MVSLKTPPWAFLLLHPMYAQSAVVEWWSDRVRSGAGGEKETRGGNLEKGISVGPGRVVRGKQLKQRQGGGNSE